LFQHAERIRPESYNVLDTKALKLTGGPQVPQSPQGRLCGASSLCLG